MTTIYHIQHPCGASAEVRALDERMALDCLIQNTQNADWEAGTVTVLRRYRKGHERSPVEILNLDEPFAAAF